MTLSDDGEILAYASAFRRAVLQGSRSTRMCAALSAPLNAALRELGVACELEESELEECNHIFLRLTDGRVLDVTADQFNLAGCEVLPAVYLGPASEIHRGARMWPGENDWPNLMAEMKRLYPEFGPGKVGMTVRVVLQSLPAGLVEFSPNEGV